MGGLRMMGGCGGISMYSIECIILLFIHSSLYGNRGDHGILSFNCVISIIGISSVDVIIRRYDMVGVDGYKWIIRDIIEFILG